MGLGSKQNILKIVPFFKYSTAASSRILMIKVHLDPPPILVQSSQKLQDNGTKKSQNILFGKKLLIYEFFRFLVSFYFSALKYFENTPMAGITHGRS